MIKYLDLSIQIFTKELRDLPDLVRRSKADDIITNKQSELSDIESLFLGYEDNVLVCSKNYPDTDTFLDHDENDPITQSYFSLYKTKIRSEKMRYLEMEISLLITGIKYSSQNA